MKTQSRLARALALMLGAFGVPNAPADPPPAKPDWNLTALDQILAAVPPGERLAQIGDMQILVSRLRVWRDQLAGRPTVQLAFDGLAPRWPGGKVFYAFSNNVSTAKQQAFLDGAQEWATFANLEFIVRTTQANYILVVENPSLGGGQSAVGMVGGAQLLQLGPYAWNRGTICHELGHALGLIHEHQRSDRDSFVKILTNNFTPGTEINFVKLPNSNNRGAYDFYSVMHYARNTLSVDPATLDTIQPLPAYSQFLNIMGGDNDTVLSAADRAGMPAVYGPGPLVTNRVTHTRDSGPGSLRAALYFAHDHPGTTVAFDIPTSDPGFSNQVFNIQPTDILPTLAHGTTLDGASQPTNANPSGPAILLSGTLSWTPSVYPQGLRLRGTNCIVRRLVINGFAANGLLITGSNTTANFVEGCHLGVSPDGTVAVTNGQVPVLINGGARGNTIGGSTAAARNIIAGSAYQGLVIADAGTRENIVAGNYIGLNAAGTAALPNRWSGVAIYGGAQSNLIGGTTSGARNVISGNTLQGVALSDAGTIGNAIAGNFIGLNSAGTAALPNGWSGVNLYGGAQSNLIGGATSAARNVISGNTLQGVVLSDAGTDGNVVAGNFIGLNSAGTVALPNGWAGVDIWGAAKANVVGPGNVISGNSNPGVSLSSAGTTDNVVQGNWIGLDATGASAVPNGWSGLQVSGGAQANRVGGASAAQRNVISGNSNQGVVLAGTGTQGNIIAGNFIGLDATGAFAVPNAWSGVDIFSGASANVIGGGFGARNVISGNFNFGVLLSGAGTDNNVIQGNTLGLDVSGLNPVPNSWAGVEIFGGARSNQIGGTTLGAANLIAANLGGGVLLFDADTTNNAIRANSIYANTSVGIYLDGGANASAAAPVLSSTVVGTNTTVSGSLNSTPGTTFALDFFSTPAGAPAQGKTYLGSATVLTSGGGSVSFTASLGATVPLGSLITATATDPSGNTSAFSSSRVATGTDTVGDGLPNAWRAARFGGPGTTTNATSCATCDPDHDGLINRQEFLAGTDPANAASALRISSAVITPDGAQLEFPSVTGVSYRVETRSDLGSGSRSLLADQLLGTGGVLQLLDPGARLAPAGFYRLRVQP